MKCLNTWMVFVIGCGWPVIALRKHKADATPIPAAIATSPDESAPTARLPMLRTGNFCHQQE